MCLTGKYLKKIDLSNEIEYLKLFVQETAWWKVYFGRIMGPWIFISIYIIISLSRTRCMVLPSLRIHIPKYFTTGKIYCSKHSIAMKESTFKQRQHWPGYGLYIWIAPRAPRNVRLCRHLELWEAWISWVDRVSARTPADLIIRSPSKMFLGICDYIYWSWYFGQRKSWFYHRGWNLDFRMNQTRLENSSVFMVCSTSLLLLVLWGIFHTDQAPTYDAPTRTTFLLNLGC